MATPRTCVICEAALTWDGGNSRSQLCDSPNCESKFRRHLNCKWPCCRACGRPMGNYKTAPGFLSVCATSECQIKATAIRNPHAAFCRICGIYLSNHCDSGTQPVCQSPFCRRWDSSNTMAETQKIRAGTFMKRRSELEEIAQERARVLLPELSQDTLSQDTLSQDTLRKTIVLPYLEHNLKPSTPERRQKVEVGFLEIANVAYASNEELSPQPVTNSVQSDCELSPAAPSSLAPATDELFEQRFARLNGSACSTCGGRCCKLGSDHAFLRVDKFREIFRERPDATPEGIVAEYMARIPEESFEYSCIFHGLNGCSLTREQRSVTCNNYLCSSLELLRNHVWENTSKFLMAATNLRDDDIPELKVYRIKIVQDDHERMLESAPNDRISL